MDTAFQSSETGSGATDSAVTESFRSSSGVPVYGAFNLDALDQEHFESDYGDDSVLADKGKGKSRATAVDANPSTSEFDGVWHNATTSIPTARHEEHGVNQTDTYIHNAEDGAAVVSLLSDPSFQPDLLPDDPDQYLDGPVAPLTPEELRIIDSFRRSAQPPPSETQLQETQSSRPITSQSLIPDIDTFLAQHNEGDATTASATALRNSVLASLPGAEEWMAVDERYHEEVWGYLRPALQAAERELEEQKDSGGDQGREGPAVRRLKMILRHMQL
jgi:hypothetical protein